MLIHEMYMKRCIQLALKGSGYVAPNPMVGCVIVHEGKIIGEGYHEIYGGPHAEVNAINSVENKELLKSAVIYVSLEPCNHFGKTPPCSDLIVKHHIPEAVIGCSDSFEKVAGKGIEKLQNAGIKVTTGVLEKDCRQLNKRFFTFHEKKRPFIILKWAQTPDGFISRFPEDINNNNWITGEESKILAHQLRASESAILIGSNTAKIDNPELTTRLAEGKNPLRIVFDKELSLPAHLHIFDRSTPTLVINSVKDEVLQNLEYLKVEWENVAQKTADLLYKKNITSVIIEGGAHTLNTFISAGLWDEAMVFTGNEKFGSGIKAPKINSKKQRTVPAGKDLLTYISSEQLNY
ncbi:MAG: bifunctional diaminohydroxyphosphoribosylaminopyrimidine deaminase/5-amino-6-(5-phosphoribosylamino)uracil reductase RibD [Bacteroidetes bacterium]|nr:bifunctional diaminohydroxyphosphoribosylaminopyrimidine deaminase/5-amino-6-(5-phosphoribosylamino)uracil reductase RibD [Bacteroidota bacterium]